MNVQNQNGNQRVDEELPQSPMRQRDPEPDRITRPDTLPPPNSAPVQPSIPQTAPATSPVP
jgi:hypothetical protein